MKPPDMEILLKPRRSVKLTLAFARVTLKCPENMPQDQQEFYIDFTRRICHAIDDWPHYAVRGEFKDWQGRKSITLRDRQDYSKTFFYDSLPPAPDSALHREGMEQAHCADAEQRPA